MGLNRLKLEDPIAELEARIRICVQGAGPPVLPAVPGQDVDRRSRTRAAGDHRAPRTGAAAAGAWPGAFRIDARRFDVQLGAARGRGSRSSARHPGSHHAFEAAAGFAPSFPCRCSRQREVPDLQCTGLYSETVFSCGHVPLDNHGHRSGPRPESAWAADRGPQTASDGMASGQAAKSRSLSARSAWRSLASASRSSWRTFSRLRPRRRAISSRDRW
jgi:hypothetical protein